jgi:hypothetical protein
MVVWMSACRSKRATSWIGVPAWTSQLAQVRRRSCGVQGAIPARLTAVAKPFLMLAMRSPFWWQKTQGEAGQFAARNRARSPRQTRAVASATPARGAWPVVGAPTANTRVED